jgi:hypothetical protein
VAHWPALASYAWKVRTLGDGAVVWHRRAARPAAVREAGGQVAPRAHDGVVDRGASINSPCSYYPSTHSLLSTTTDGAMSRPCGMRGRSTHAGPGASKRSSEVQTGHGVTFAMGDIYADPSTPCYQDGQDVQCRSRLRGRSAGDRACTTSAARLTAYAVSTTRSSSDTTIQQHIGSPYRLSMRCGTLLGGHGTVGLPLRPPGKAHAPI